MSHIVSNTMMLGADMMAHLGFASPATSLITKFAEKGDPIWTTLATLDAINAPEATEENRQELLKVFTAQIEKLALTNPQAAYKFAQQGSNSDIKSVGLASINSFLKICQLRADKPDTFDHLSWFVFSNFDNLQFGSAQLNEMCKLWSESAKQQIQRVATGEADFGKTMAHALRGINHPNETFYADAKALMEAISPYGPPVVAAATTKNKPYKPH